MTKNAFGTDNRLPLCEVDAHGSSVEMAVVGPLVPDGFLVQPLMGKPSVLLSDSENGVYDDLPYFLDDLRPQGFLGRQIAEEMAEQLDEFPPDPRRWRDVLVTEYYAAEVNRSLDISAVETRLHEVEDRLFLETRRFDRVGEYGRMSSISLQVVDAEFVGLGLAGQG
jgi:hypothetical protein